MKVGIIFNFGILCRVFLKQEELKYTLQYFYEYKGSILVEFLTKVRDDLGVLRIFLVH